VTSQFRTLEPLGADENGLVLDLDLPVDELVSRFLAATTDRADQEA
jgi:gluconokinase